MRRFALTLAGLAFSATSSIASESTELQRAFPLTLEAADGEVGRALTPRARELEELITTERTRLRLTDVPTPAGGTVQLELERVHLDYSSTEVWVDGGLQPGGLDASRISLWSGRVAGQGGEVFLGFSRSGTRGWFRAGGELVHLLVENDPRGLRQRLASESELQRAGARFEVSCNGPLEADARPPGLGSGTAQAGSGQMLECKMAWETDYQLFQQFPNLTAEQDYMMMVLGAVDFRFREQIQVALTPAYLAFYTNPNDPWSTPENGGNTIDMLNEFVGAWGGNIPAGANLAHFLSGAPLGGGVAYLDVLCNPSIGFAVSANLTQFGMLPSNPAVQGPMTWDFFVISHELGHNFDSPHTFNYTPQIDDCPNVCTTQGTIMSYCHLCTGGTSNITTFFHPRVVVRMRAASEASCFPDFCDGGFQSYCISNGNTFSATGAVLGASGSASVSNNDLVLEVADAAADKFGLFFYGPNQVQTLFGEGFRCVGGAAFRLSPLATTDGLGTSSHALDLNASPANAGPGEVEAGSTWNFQFWFRDPMGGPSGFNLSDGLAVSFCP